LFDQSVVDTPAVDETVPDRSVKGLKLDPDYGVNALGEEGQVVLQIVQYNPTAQPITSQMVFDNLCARILGPPLTVEPTVSPNVLMLSWPASTTSFQPESAPNLSGPWSNALEAITQNGSRNEMIVTASGSKRFYRLRTD
jgi:hypothetical protein